EVLWDSPDVQLPWALTPMIWDDEAIFLHIQQYCIAGFLLIPISLLVAFLMFARKWRSRDAFERKRYAADLFWDGGAICLWSGTDALWALGADYAALVSSVAVIFFIYAAALAQSTDSGWCVLDRTDVVWIIWSFSNFLWIYAELFVGGSLQMRYLAAAVGFLALLVLWGSFEQLKVRACRGEPQFVPPSFTLSKETSYWNQPYGPAGQSVTPPTGDSRFVPFVTTISAA
ncbi:unnamed protein product, partial [Polarella glacialis]